jgi:hypothetical protein
MFRPVLASALLAALLASAVPAAQNGAPTPPPATAPGTTPAAPGDVVLTPPAGVYCGSALCFRIRATALGKDPESRANIAIDVINKYLGGRIGKVTTKVDGKNIKLFLNNEFVTVVTAADAAAEKIKTPTLLATKWAKQLSDAFEASKAQR